MNKREFGKLNPDEKLAKELEPVRDIRAEWFKIFSEEETLQIIKNQQLPALEALSLQNSVGLFRASNSGKEEMEETTRSYSYTLFDVQIYLKHRILKSIQDHHSGGGIEVARIFTPIFKILNTKVIPSEAVKKGAEVHEFEVDESKIVGDNLVLKTPEEVYELKQVFEEVLNKYGESKEKYFMFEKSLDKIAVVMKEIYTLLEKNS